jgi:phage repressor protein C with HTH and peptisase S24 domain
LVKTQTSAPAAALKVISVAGDSMAPDFLPGERVLVDTSHKVPSPPGAYVLWDGFGIVLKRLEIIPNSEPPSVRLIPRNGQYAIYERPLADVHIHARVIGKWTWT